MQTKSQPDEMQSYLADASNLAGGHAARVVFPETAEEAAAVLREASAEGVAVTVSGAGTGVVGGRVPFGGVVLATDRLNRIGEIVAGEQGGRATVEAGVTLADFRRAVESRGLLYPPDPTEWSCYMGGTVVTNASGARTFKYGATRRYIRRLKIALATGDVLDLARGEVLADHAGRLHIPLGAGRAIEAQLPAYRMPPTRKHAAGYYVEPGMDAVDLFIGSEGTLGVVVEIEAALLPKPAGVLSGVVFFTEEENLLAFVRAAREASLDTRAGNAQGELDARALEFFDAEALNFLREKYPSIPADARGAIFFEQETTEATEERLMDAWLALLERHDAALDASWFATDERDQARLRDFRHALPVLVNEWLARHGQRKVSTDMSVPDEAFAAMLRFYQETLRASGLQYVIFGHIGDNHVHVNILPRDDAQAAGAREIYGQFIARAVAVGGTISAEHGVGKIKRDYLRALYGDEHLRQMAALKRAFDPACILGRGNIFAEELL
ncbi:MAG TPA: FAD-binding oxidoreductase [Pyrinomonadaceae bacterium]|jgi:D-lactate dehydrogenase (cytochrome)|nr:FAD-binding oxidoreductase [Pyrinomonadaceae bacterium]